MPELTHERKPDALPRTVEERALLRMTEALTAAAQAAHAEGDDLVSVYIYDRSRETLGRLKQVERILGDPEHVLFAVLPVEIPLEVGQ